MRWFLALFAWRFVMQQGAWLYYENAMSRERRAVWSGAGHSPQDVNWLTHGLGG